MGRERGFEDLLLFAVIVAGRWGEEEQEWGFVANKVIVSCHLQGSGEAVFDVTLRRDVEI